MLKVLVKQLLQLPTYWRLVPVTNKQPIGQAWQHPKNAYKPRQLVQALIDNQGLLKVDYYPYQIQATGYGLLLGFYPQGYCYSKKTINGTLTIFTYQKGVKALPDDEFTSKR